MTPLEAMRTALSVIDDWNAVKVNHEYSDILASELRTVIAEMEKAEPVAWMNKSRFEYAIDSIPVWPRKIAADFIPLYTHPTIPESWQLVPVEPTDEMCRALWRRDRLDTCRIIWERALQAAPKPEDV